MNLFTYGYGSLSTTFENNLTKRDLFKCSSLGRKSFDGDDGRFVCDGLGPLLRAGSKELE